VEEAKNVAALLSTQRVMAADQLVVCHAAIGQRHGAPGLDVYPATARKAGPEHHRIQQVALEAQVLRHRAVIERAGQRRDEVDVTAGPALQKAAAWDLDQNLDLGWFLRSVPERGFTWFGSVHSARVHSPQQAEKRREIRQIALVAGGAWIRKNPGLNKRAQLIANRHSQIRAGKNS
jgi:hypothetical protein